MAKIRDGSTYLGEHLTRNDYYAKNEQVVGCWVGKLSHNYGLDQGLLIQSGDSVFEGLRQGKTPNGEKLTQRNGSEVKFYDFQCSAQKSVSILAVMMRDLRLREAHEKASNLAFSELERFASMRDRKGLKAWSEDNIKTGNLLAAKFTHDASRELDPQLHSHFVVANVTVGPDGKRHALDTKLMCQAIRYAGKVYQAEMAKACRDLGYEIRQKTNQKGQIEGFEIEGVSDEINKRYSKRRVDVERAIEKFRSDKNREPSTREIAILTKDSRKDRYNMHEISTPEVREKQLDQLSLTEKQGLESILKQAHGNGPLPLSTIQVTQPLRSAIEHIFERQSVAERHEILAEALGRGLGDVTMQDLNAWAEPEIVPLNNGEGLNEKFTTVQNLTAEKWAVDHVNRTKNKRKALVPNSFEVPHLSDEQNQAVQFVGNSRDQVNLLRGIAGAGKTTTLKAIDSAVTSEGHSSMYLAPSTSAVSVLKQEGFKNVTTVADFLVRMETGTATQEMKSSLLVIDEAGLLSTKQGARLLKAASRNKSRVLLVGDSKQHSAVESGDFVRILEEHSNIARHELLTIRRQRPKEYREAVLDLANGQAQAGLDRIDGLGWITEQKDYQMGAATQYVECLLAGQSVIAVAPTHEEGREMTEHIRAELKDQGYLYGETVIKVFDNFQLTEADKKKISAYKPGSVISVTNGSLGTLKQGQTLGVVRIRAGKLILSNGETIDPAVSGAKYAVGCERLISVAPGDKLLITANDKKSGLINGDRLTFLHFNQDGAIETKEGKTIPNDFRHFSYGYVSTSHKAQGVTADRVVIATQIMDSKAAYVSISRGRDRVDIFTPDKEHLRRGMKNDSKRAAALDSLRSESKRTRLERVLLWSELVKNRVSEIIRGFRRSVRPTSAIRTEREEGIRKNWHQIQATKIAATQVISHQHSQQQREQILRTQDKVVQQIQIKQRGFSY